MAELSPGAGNVDPRTPLLSFGGFADWLRERIAKREPAAAVRFAGGEEQLLFAHRDDPESVRAAVEKLNHDGGGPFTAADALELAAAMRWAFDAADVLGVRITDRVLDSHKRSVRRLVALYEERVAAGRNPAALASCMLGHDVTGELPELLRGHPVSVVSSRDLQPVLEGEWGLVDVAVHQVPSEHPVRDVDGAYEAAMHGVPVWPDFHRDFLERLVVRQRGEVFLVGAGVFGKDLCVRIRDAGGIALDMGSALDVIAGKLTRGPRRRVLDLHAAGLSPAEIASQLERLYGARVEKDRISRAIAELTAGRPTP